jgi:pimeloyl-ACP methyl ester esterase
MMHPELFCATIGTGRPLVCVHGWAMRGDVWKECAQELSGQHAVTLIDLRGHGESRPLSGPYTFAGCADDLAGLLSGAAFADCTLVGWSMGASVLLTMFARAAAQLRARVRSMVLISGNPSLVQRDDYAWGLPGARVRRLYEQVARNYPDGLRNFHRLLYTEEETARLSGEPAYLRMMDSTQAPSRPAALETLQCLMDEDLRPALGVVADIPTLIVHGGRDRVCHPMAADYMHKRIRRSQLLMLDDAGHVPFVSRAAEVYRALGAFLRA